MTRKWDTVRKTPRRETFGYFNVADFEPDRWKNEYANPAFDRMTERDATWMARILAGFTPEMVRTLAEMARFEDPGNTSYLASVLEGRLAKILQRYLARVSPLARVHVEGGDRLCAVDLAESRGLRDAGSFRYAARLAGGGWLGVARLPGARVCVALPRVAANGGLADDDARRYAKVIVEDGFARGPLVAHLYDLGPSRGYFLAGLERPDP